MNCVYLILFMALQCQLILKLGAVEMDNLQVQEEEKIIEGDLVKEKQFPWMAAIFRRMYNSETKKVSQNFFHFCGGSIINEHYVLSAAHCIYSYKNGTTSAEYLFGVNDFRVYTGLLNIEPIGNSPFKTVKKLIIHPQFNNFTYLNDIAIFKLAEKITFNHVVRPITITHIWIGEEQLATTAGWEKTCNEVKKFGPLRYVDTTVVASDKCMGKEVPEKVSLITDTRAFICAGPPTPFSGGDSGGGLWITDEFGNYLIGIVSQAVPCSNKLIKVLPALFTRLSHYQNWIDESCKM